MTESQQEPPVSEALRILRLHMTNDPELAWSWHCTIACIMQDAGINHTAANKAAARFMLMAFEVRTDIENIRSSNTENTNVEFS